MSWHEQKAAVLRGEANYDYWAWEFDDRARIPTDVIRAGMPGHNYSRMNAYGGDAAPTLPRHAQGLYAPHKDLTEGFAIMSDEFIRQDYAPFLRTEKNWQLGILGTMHNRQPQPQSLVGNSVGVAATDVQLREPGNAIGTVIGDRPSYLPLFS